jgi:hypothetical protein
VIFYEIAKSRIMKRALPFLALLFLAGCQQIQKMTPTERRLVGEWQYTNVDYWPLWGFKEDITNEVDHLLLQFNEDFTMTLVDPELNESYTGIWEVNIVSVSGPNNTVNSAEELIASASNDITGEVIQIIWENIGVTNSRIDADHDTKDGSFIYRLRKN